MTRLTKISFILLIVGFVLLTGSIVLKVHLGSNPDIGKDIPVGPSHIALNIIIIIGVIFESTGIVGLGASMIRYFVVILPKMKARHSVEHEFAPLIDSGHMREVPVSFPVAKKLSGSIDEIPLEIQISYHATGPFGILRYSRADFFSPFPGDFSPGFRLYPTGKRARESTDIEGNFSRMFSHPKSDSEAFIRSGLGLRSMEAFIQFQRRNGGILSMDDRGIFWNIPRIEFEGTGVDILREFAELSSIARREMGISEMMGEVKGDALSHKEIEASKGPNHQTMPLSSTKTHTTQPAYATSRQLIIVFGLLLVSGITTLIGSYFAKTYGNDDLYLLLLVIGLFVVTPGIIGMPLLSIHLIRNRPASRR